MVYQRKDTNNFFTIRKEKLKKYIFGIGCTFYILHITMYSSVDIFSINIEIIVNKIFQYIYIYNFFI